MTSNVQRMDIPSTLNTQSGNRKTRQKKKEKGLRDKYSRNQVKRKPCHNQDQSISEWNGCELLPEWFPM